MLVGEVKEVLKITWGNEDAFLANIINRGKNYLEDLTGVKLDFNNNDQAKSLLLNYCRYDYNSALEYFEDNFQKQIIRLQYKEAIRVSKEVVTGEG